MSNGKIARVILIDEPTSQDFFHGKGHDRTARALASAIKNFKSSDRAIGLDGPWGSGKSSVVSIAQKSLNAGNSATKFHFFTFDIWSSQGASFRRSFLEHFIRWAKQEFPRKFSVLEKIDNDVRGKTKIINSSNKSVLDWYGIIVILFIPILPIYYFWAKGFYDSAPAFFTFIFSQPLMLFYAFLVLTLFRALCRFSAYLKIENSIDSKNFWSGAGRLFQIALSQTLLISTKSYEDQTVTEHIREVDPNDFEFQATLRWVLGELQDDNNKVVVVLDNIDRLPKDEIDDYWALVRSVFSRGSTHGEPRSEEAITAIVPYDRHLIGSAEPAFDDQKGKAGLRSIRSREIFSKTFDEILAIAPPVMSNSREFFQDKMRKALPNYHNEDDLIRVYLIFNQIILRENGKATPRQILSFINELTGIYALHEGRVVLSTIAVFIAYQDELELNPNNLTDKAFISERLRTIASDAELEKSLAALIFNVEPDLAFQILLDDQIQSASISADADLIVKLAASPGFDLRVGEVIARNVREWQGAGDFGKVISNYSTLVSNDDISGKRHYFDALVAAFFSMNLIGSTQLEFGPYLKIFGISKPEYIPGVAKHFISCIFNQLKLKSASEIKDGQELAKAILAVQTAAQSDGGLASGVKFLPAFPAELQVAPVVFGLAQTMYDSGFAFTSLGVGSLNLEEESTYLSDMAVEAPKESLRALSELHNAGLLKSPQLKQVGNAILANLYAERDEYVDDVPDLLSLLGEVWKIIPAAERSELSISEANENVNLFDNLYEEYSDRNAGQAFAVALTLFGQSLTSAGYTIGNSDENGQGYAWFTGIISGNVSIDETVYSGVSDFIISSSQSGVWTAMGSKHQENRFFTEITRCMYLGNNTPSVTLEAFLSNYDYIRNVVGSHISSVIKMMNGRASSGDFKFLNFENIPLSLILDSYEFGGDSWRTLHLRIDELFNATPNSVWEQELDNPSVISNVLEKKLSTSGFLIDAPSFRSNLEKFVCDVVNGIRQPADFNYDQFFNAIDVNFHPDMYRKVREALTTVSPDSLAVGQLSFPKFLRAVIVGGDKISKAEKDSIVRHLLAPALEGRNAEVLNYFVVLGSTKVREYVKSANDSTQRRIEAAEKSFHRGHANYSYAQSIADLLHGKRKARNLFEALWDVGARGD